MILKSKLIKTGVTKRSIVNFIQFRFANRKRLQGYRVFPAAWRLLSRLNRIMSLEVSCRLFSHLEVSCVSAHSIRRIFCRSISAAERTIDSYNQDTATPFHIL